MTTAKFTIGQIVEHTLFGYRGVIVDIDPSFQGGEGGAKKTSVFNPVEQSPWYRVLVDQADYDSYVAERNLDVCADLAPIQHPKLALYFDQQVNGLYINRPRTMN